MLLSVAVCPEPTTWALNITQLKSFQGKQGRLAGGDFFSFLSFFFFKKEKTE